MLRRDAAPLASPQNPLPIDGFRTPFILRKKQLSNELRSDTILCPCVQVEMERSYLTAEVFREILQQNGRSAENGEIIRTLSGRQV